VPTCPLLQDIAVAPLLVILPLLAGSGTDFESLEVLVVKGTFGFGAVLAVGAVVLRQMFSVVAATRSSETFVAAALLVAVGMGAAKAYEVGGA
jgi:Kef-type K+ transport system membrane component KefB